MIPSSLSLQALVGGQGVLVAAVVVEVVEVVAAVAAVVIMIYTGEEGDQIEPVTTQNIPNNTIGTNTQFSDELILLVNGKRLTQHHERVCGTSSCHVSVIYCERVGGK